ncbi:MAG: cytochrome c1 [Acetobacteraceae bacterium]|nr:cytochrome c1 [Acetobacteraceae bacterium]
MRALRSLLAGAAMCGLACVTPLGVTPARAAENVVHPPQQRWDSAGVFGTVDLASAKRGFQVYQEVCAMCHGMKQMSYRHLTGLGLTEEDVKAIAATVTVPLGTNDAGEPVEGPALPSSYFREPYANDKVARMANNGSLPPDLSVMVLAREAGADYVYALLVGYADPPVGIQMGTGMYYNKYFPGHQIAMPQPLMDDRVEYSDGTKATVEQMARDVTEFMIWSASPEMTERKQIGVWVILFLVFMTGITYALKRKVWADVH